MIKVSQIKTALLVEEAVNLAAGQAQYCEPWILLDKDQNLEFNLIIKKADKNNINVAWSNPCIEIWFSAYFGKMLSCSDSVSCCRKFCEMFKKKTGHDYVKSDREIYSKLCKYGDENKAILHAGKRMDQHWQNNICEPSKMLPGTNIYILIEKIKSKSKQC